MTFIIKPVGICAAELTGLDVARPFSDVVSANIKHAWSSYPVLIFRDQHLSPSQMAAFGRCFGRLESYGHMPAVNGQKHVAALPERRARETPNQMLYLSPDDPDVLVMTNEVRAGLPHVGIVDNAEMWHSDASHKAEPCQAIIVHVVRNPAAGGDTEFCDMRAVYDALPFEVRENLAGRKAIHHWSKSKNALFDGVLSAEALAEGKRIADMIPDRLQPLVRTHPDTGRQSLYVSPRFTIGIEGVAETQAREILSTIFSLADQTQFHYRHQWREHDLVIWDNRCLNHRVRGYASGDVRCRHRVTVAGDRPFFRDSPDAEDTDPALGPDIHRRFGNAS